MDQPAPPPGMPTFTAPAGVPTTATPPGVPTFSAPAGPPGMPTFTAGPEPGASPAPMLSASMRSQVYMGPDGQIAPILARPAKPPRSVGRLIAVWMILLAVFIVVALLSLGWANGTASTP